MKNIDEDFFEFLVATDQLDDFLGLKEENDPQEELEEDDDEDEENN